MALWGVMTVFAEFKDRTDTETRILEATIRAFLRYGPKKMTMGDVAEEAGLTRKTVYVAFENKDNLLAEMVRYIGHKQLTRVAEAWQGCKTLAEKLDVYTQIVVLEPFDALQATDDPQEMVNLHNETGRIALTEVRDNYVALWAEQLTGYESRLENAGTTRGRLARFIVTTNQNLKRSETDRARLVEQLEDLHLAVLTLTQSG